MIEQIQPDLFKIEIPLPRNPLRALNSYVIKGDGRSLIIDTGMNREECLEPMLQSLRELNVDLDNTDFFITHLHADHLGQVGKLKTDSSRIYFSEVEAAVIAPEQKDPEERRRESFDFYVSHGFPEEELKAAIQNHPGFRYSPKRQITFTTLREGDTVEVGDYAFTCILTPGHSPGHMCLYESNKKILVSGDHILFDITPNITTWPQLENSLKSYLDSLDKVSTLDVDLILPGHRNLMNDLRGRINELKEHHKNRLDEVVVALKSGDKTSWEMASHITWDIDFRSWEDFPAVQKWFALGETIAHLVYLVADGTITKNDVNGRIIYSLS
jgi:glyoxylase-like metal-dependent hydrolase (beta-lactamase superfamily II)